MAKLTYLVKQTRLRLTIMLGVMLFVTSMNIYAARFGNMQVLSQKGEPLRAKIEILDVPADEQGWLTLRSAPQYAYDNAALRFTNAAKELRAMVERDKDGKMIAWLTTSTPVNEEFIDLLLTLNWSTGRMTEAFTLLVPHHAVAQAHEQIAAPIVFGPDTSKNQVTVTPNINNSLQASKPQSDTSSIAAIEINPELNGPSSAAEIHSNATEAKVNSEPLQILPKPEQQRTQTKAAIIPTVPQSKPPAEKMISSHKPKQNYKVKRGDTLSKIAEQFRQDEPESVTLDQLLVAMYQDNPQAFMGKNMNRLKAGAILKFPVVEEANKINMAQASKQVQLQAGEFERYRTSLAEAATVSKASSNMRTSSGQISAAVKENLTKQPADKLKLSRGNAIAQQREEQKIAQQRAVNDAKEQVDQLEKHVADLQKLAAQASTQSAQVTPAQNGVPVALAKPSPFTEIDKTLQKVQRFFSGNPAVSLGILMSFLVSGALMLRRRARRKTLFSSRVQHEVPPTAQKMLTSLNLDLESPVRSQKDLVSLDQRIQEPDQMNTRLELAQAYWDLGDQKGARQLLEEVIAQGSAAQRKQAQKLLSDFQ